MEPYEVKETVKDGLKVLGHAVTVAVRAAMALQPTGSSSGNLQEKVPNTLITEMVTVR